MGTKMSSVLQFLQGFRVFEQFGTSTNFQKLFLACFLSVFTNVPRFIAFCARSGFWGDQLVPVPMGTNGYQLPCFYKVSRLRAIWYQYQLPTALPGTFSFCFHKRPTFSTILCMPGVLGRPFGTGINGYQQVYPEAPGHHHAKAVLFCVKTQLYIGRPASRPPPNGPGHQLAKAAFVLVFKR